MVARVNAVAIYLNDSSPFAVVFSEGLFEVFSTSSVLPTVADAALWARVIERPDVAGAGFPGAGGEFFDGAFVDLQVAL